MERSIFERIASKEIPSEMVWENDEFVAFLDISPFTEGHVLVVPRENWGDYIFDLEDAGYQRLMMAAKEVAKLLKAKIDCERVLLWVQGFEVPHVHVHLIPAKSGFSFGQIGNYRPTRQELVLVRQKICG